MNKRFIRIPAVVVLVGLFFLLTALNGGMCKREDDNHHRSIEMSNVSEQAIYVYGDPYHYPDTVVRPGDLIANQYFLKVEPYSINKKALRARSFWEWTFGGSGMPSDTLMVFVLDAEKVEAHISPIQDALLQRYDLSLKNLQDLNWRLTYPPTPAMKHMKMYPPYKPTSGK